MHQRREANSDHDWCEGINRQKANMWSFFKLQKLTSYPLFVGKWRHIIWDMEETQIPKSYRIENTERKENAFPLNEFALRGMVNLIKQIPEAVDLSMRKDIVIKLGLIWNKMCIFLSTCYGSPIMRRKREKKRLYKIPSKWTYNKVYSNLSCCIHADMNKRQIMGGKNSSDKIEKKRRGNIPRMINLRFGVQALPLNPKIWRKVNRIYRWWTIFSPSAI